MTVGSRRRRRPSTPRPASPQSIESAVAGSGTYDAFRNSATKLWPRWTKPSQLTWTWFGLTRVHCSPLRKLLSASARPSGHSVSLKKKSIDHEVCTGIPSGRLAAV
jgi:hypothetical protein